MSAKSKVLNMPSTDALTKQMEKLFLSGVTKYTDISSELGVPYKEVNRYMTKWKKRSGLLKSHTTIVNESIPIETSELKFLRKFYIDHCKNELNL